MFLLVLMLIAPDGTQPKPPLVIPEPFAQEVCESEGARIAARLNAMEHIKKQGVVEFRCVETRPQEKSE